MQVVTELSKMFSYSSILIFIFTIIITIILVIYLKKDNQKINDPNIIIPCEKDIIKIKQNYLKELEKLTIQVEKKKINNRQAFQKLSILVRNFIYETTNLEVQNYTLSEIKKTNIPILYELVKEYYDPEFCQISKGNILNSLIKAKEVIKKWN